MGKAQFNRGLDNEFVERLNEMYKAGSWWRNLVDDKDLFLAIRENYVNFYFRGCSLLKLNWKSRLKRIEGEIHYKYLLKPSIEGSQYIKFTDSELELPKPLRSMFLDGLDDVGELKRAVLRYAGDEKKGVHNVVGKEKNPNVVDLEIAFEGGGSALRVDLADLQDDEEQGGTVKIVFYEAKHFKNAELRAARGSTPRVVDQIEVYSRLLSENRRSLIGSYRQVCCNLFKLAGVADRSPKRHKILEDIVSKSKQLGLDEQPKLIVFGFDKDQRDGKKWKAHKKKLEEALGNGNVLFASKPRDIRLGTR